MLKQSSEQALSALEHSKKPAVDLLDDAVNILNLSWESIGQVISSAKNPILNGSNARFREQWILKWLTKKLAQATGQHGQQSKKQSKGQQSDSRQGEIIQNVRAWELLHYLLIIIPARTVQEILIERNLCRTLNAAIQATVQRPSAVASTTQRSISLTPPDHESERPLKKRKLSYEEEADGTIEPKDPSFKLIHQLLRVAGQCARIFGAPQEGSQPLSESSTQAWADSLESATELLGGIIQMTSVAIREMDHAYSHASDDQDAVLAVADQWLQLWHGYSASGAFTSKQEPHKIFNTLNLIPALELLHSRRKQHNEKAFRTLERQIAIHAILPARATFRKQFSATWASKKDGLQQSEVRKLASEIGKIWGSTAVELSKSNGGALASLLLTIASRLIPRAEVAKRKVENTWLEALFLCLIHLTQTISPDPDVPNGVSFEDAPQRSVTQMSHLVQLVDAFATMDIVPSALIWHYFVERYVLAEGTHAPYSLLAKVVTLNPSIFTPDSDVGKPSLLNAVDALITDGVTHDKVEHTLIVNDILSPILQECGRSRQLTKFAEFWEVKLVDTFHDRMSAASTTPDISRHYVWDDPDLLKTFSTISQRYAIPSICRDMLDQAQKEIEGLPSIVGPTHRAFARITIATQVLNSARRSPPMRATIPQQLHSVAEALCLALGRTTDYQGHRWRLWSFLDSVIQLDPKADWVTPYTKCKAVLPLPHSSVADIASVSTNKRRATLMEQLSCVKTIVTSFESGQPGIQPIFEKAIGLITELIEKYVAQCSAVPRSTCWDGSIESMDNLNVLLSAILTRLAAMPVSWIDGTKSSHDLLTAVCTLALMEEPTTPDGVLNITASAEVLLATISLSNSVDLPGIFAEVITDKATNHLKHVPTLLHDFLVHSTSRKCTQQIVDFLLHELERNGSSMDDTCITSCLVLISESVARWTQHLGTEESFDLCADGLNKSDISGGLITFVLVAQSVGKLIQSLITPPTSADTRVEWRKRSHAILKRVKTEFKDQPLHGEAMLDTYHGILLLAVVRQLQNFHTGTADGELVKTSSKIVKRFQGNAFKSAAHYLTEESNITSIYKASMLLDALLCTIDMESSSKDLSDELRNLYQRLTEKILRFSSNSTQPLEISVLNSVREMLDKLVSSHQIVFGPQIPIAVLAKDVSKGSSHSSLELQASLALDSAYLTPTIAHASIVVLVASGDEQEFKTKGISDDTRPLFAVAAIIKNISSELLSTSPELIQAFGQIASLQSALHSWTPTGLLLRLELSKLIFENHTSIVNQHIIDTTLSSITLLATSAGKLSLNLSEQPHNPHPNHIFDRLCTILHIILIRHRRRLTGRHHLLLPALQSLLKCLFYPSSSRHQTTSNQVASPSKATYLSSLPHWLNPSPHPLPPTSATKYTRALQTLCEPTPSSARHTLKRSHTTNTTTNLTDPTHHLRTLVSHHTPYLLQTYCQTTLDGSITPEAKEKLLPGLYAVCNGMDVLVMRGMNAAMGESQRAVWRDFYGEWRRWGVWNRR